MYPRVHVRTVGLPSFLGYPSPHFRCSKRRRRRRSNNSRKQDIMQSVETVVLHSLASHLRLIVIACRQKKNNVWTKVPSRKTVRAGSYAGQKKHEDPAVNTKISRITNGFAGRSNSSTSWTAKPATGGKLLSQTGDLAIVGPTVEYRVLERRGRFLRQCRLRPRRPASFAQWRTPSSRT